MRLWRMLHPRTLVQFLVMGLMCSLATPGTLAGAAPTLAELPGATIAYAGSHSGFYNAFALEVSADRSAVVSISATTLPCGAWNWSFTLPLSPELPITGRRFSARAVLVPSISGANLDIDGVLFDADGDSTPEQAVGGLSFVTPSGVRCNVQWWATTTPDADHDGWSDAAERRLGSGPSDLYSMPEHRDLPTSAIYGPGSCRDYRDNDKDGLADAAEADGPDPGTSPDCMAPLQPSEPSPPAYAGNHSGVNNAFALELTPDGMAVVSISAVILPCQASNWSFTVPLSPSLSIASSRFSADAIPIPAVPGASLDIDGVLFDADHDSTLEQALGGLSFVTPAAARCNFGWWATAVAPSSDIDGWSDTAERRLGSDPSAYWKIPEHREVPTTPMLGPDVCHDYADNDGDNLIDQEDLGCIEPKMVYLPLVVKSVQ